MDKRMRTGVYPGTFDPITLGHLDIIRRGAHLVDKLVVGVTTNPSKEPMFSVEERLAMVRREVADIPGAKCWCTHSCFIHGSTKFSPKVLLFHIPWSYLKHRWNRLPAIPASDFEPYRVNDAPQAS